MEEEIEVCSNGNRCPYLNFESVKDVLSERDYFKERYETMEMVLNLSSEKIKSLQKRIETLEEENKTLKEGIKEEHQKPYKKERRQKRMAKRGAPFGHPGVTRKKPERIDTYVDVYLKSCPTPA